MSASDEMYLHQQSFKGGASRGLVEERSVPGGGNRTVNIEPALAKILDEHLNGRSAGCVFQTENGTPFSKDSVRRKLVAVLDKLGLKRGGLHAFRHGRLSVLQEKGVPGDAIRISAPSFASKWQRKWDY